MRAPGRRVDDDAMAARDEARRFGQDADLLAAPAHRRFGVRRSSAAGARSAQLAARQAASGRRLAELDAVQARVDAVAREQLGVRALLDDAALRRARRCGRRARSSTAGARSRSSCARASASRAPPAPGAPTRSRARDVASSRIRIGASFRIARAIAMRWRWPPDSRTPFSPTAVSKPCGSARMKSSACAAAAARSIASRGVLGHRAVGDVRGDRVVEQQHVLRHQRDLRAQARERQRRDVVAVDEQAARRRLVEARDQVDERRLAAARRADQRDGLAGRDRERDVGERLALGARVAQRHALEAQLAARALERRRCRRPARPRGRAGRRCSRPRRGRAGSPR